MKQCYTALALVTVLSGCYRYTSLGACEAEATATHLGGGPVYSGFECRSIVLGMVRAMGRYDGDESVRSGSPAEGYILLRSSRVDPEMRIYIATFEVGPDPGR